MKRLIIILAAIVTVNCLTVTTAVSADYSARTIEISAVDGSVKMTKGTAKEYAARAGQKLSDGYTVLTGKGSTARIKLDSASILVMDEKTTVKVSKVSSSKLSLTVVTGAVSVDAEKQKTGDSLEIRAGNVALGVRGTSFVVEVGYDGIVQITMLTGFGEIGGKTVTAGKVMTITEISGGINYAQAAIDIGQMSSFALKTILEKSDELITLGIISQKDITSIPALITAAETREAVPLPVPTEKPTPAPTPPPTPGPTGQSTTPPTAVPTTPPTTQPTSAPTPTPQPTPQPLGVTFAQAFPDANFRAAVMAILVETDDTRQMTVVDATALAAIGTLDLSNGDITSLIGLSYFTGITNLDCSGNRLLALDITGSPLLTILDCSLNYMEDDGDVIGSAGHAGLAGGTFTFLPQKDPIFASAFPDAAFRQAVLDLGLFGGATENDTILPADITAMNSMAILNVSGLGVSSMKGLKYFTGLTSLNCSGNNLMSLDVSHITNLTSLDCSGNLMTGTGDVTGWQPGWDADPLFIFYPQR